MRFVRNFLILWVCLVWKDSFDIDEMNVWSLRGTNSCHQKTIMKRTKSINKQEQLTTTTANLPLALSQSSLGWWSAHCFSDLHSWNFHEIGNEKKKHRNWRRRLAASHCRRPVGGSPNWPQAAVQHLSPSFAMARIREDHKHLNKSIFQVWSLN